MKILKKNCSARYCNQPAHVGSLCKNHYEESEKNKKRESDATYALFYKKVDDSIITKPEILDEMDRLAVWWRKCCDSLNKLQPDRVLGNEANSLSSDCIILAQLLVDAERAYRSNFVFDENQLNDTRQRVWTKFNNLKNGLTSNGEVRRPN